MADCSEIRDRIYSFVVGECDIESAGVIREHLRDCPACAAELKRMRAVVRLTGRIESINPSRDLCREVMARIRPPLFWLKVAGAAAAAAVLIVVFLYSLVGLPGPVPAPEPEEVADSSEDREDINVADGGKVAPNEAAEQKKHPAPSPDDNGEMLAREDAGSEKDAVYPRKQPVPQAAEGKEPLADLPEHDTEKLEKSVVKKASPAPSQEKVAAVAKVGSLVGEVRVRRKGSADWLEGKALLSILPGDTMETNALGQVRVDFDGGDYIYVNTNSRVDFAGSGEEPLVKVNKGEVYCETEDPERELAVKTGSGEVRSREGRFSVKMFGESQCLLQVLSGEVKCCESEKGYTGKHGQLTRMWLRRGRRCDKGTKLRSKEDFRWVMKLQPRSDDDAGKHAGKPGKQDKPGKHDPGLPPGAVPKPGGEHGQEPGGKVGPGPSPMPPPPGGSGPGPGNGHGPGANPGGKK